MRERENLPVLTFDDRRMSTLLVHILSRSTNNTAISRPVCSLFTAHRLIYSAEYSNRCCRQGDSNQHVNDDEDNNIAFIIIMM